MATLIIRKLITAANTYAVNFALNFAAMTGLTAQVAKNEQVAMLIA